MQAGSPSTDASRQCCKLCSGIRQLHESESKQRAMVTALKGEQRSCSVMHNNDDASSFLAAQHAEPYCKVWCHTLLRKWERVMVAVLRVSCSCAVPHTIHWGLGSLGGRGWIRNLSPTGRCIRKLALT